MSLSFIASAPRGLADLLARELVSFGAGDVRERSTGVSFRGSLEVAYRACLWSRVANRIFLELATWDVKDAEAFYAAAREFDWAAHIDPAGTLACDFSGRHPAITHTHFGALKLKDAVCDALRERCGTRPNVSPDRPDVRLHAHAQGTAITVSLDLSGESLHRRGYRTESGEAPLKENVAAGILLRCGWSGKVGTEFLDPMCGSGTFVIEAALIAARRAPALTREYFGFLGWKRHDADLWNRLREEARAQSLAQEPTEFTIRGCDRDAAAIRVAEANARRAGVDGLVCFEVRALEQAAPASQGQSQVPGLLCTNPPYGVRLDDREGALVVHRELGRVLRERFQGWQAGILTAAPDLAKALDIRAYRTHTVWNGPLECRLLRLKVEPEYFAENQPARGAVRIDPALRDTPGARMFANRLAKNLSQLSRWAAREGVSCYRLYEADMPEYAFAIDSYLEVGTNARWLYVQEYEAPASIDPEAVRRRRGEALAVLPEVTGVPVERIRLRTRRRNRRGEQYRKLGEEARFHVVEEGGLKFLVNFDDYLDTGLFLDHRLTRARLREAAAGVRFLNLFAYTGTATVYAAAGGARSTTTVDMSRTYLDWARRNLALNGLTGPQHVLIQADCLQWLEEAARGRERYELIFLDPPTFSNSKRMRGVLDTRRDHPRLIDAAARLLAPGGLLVFTTNAQRFRLDPQLHERYEIRDTCAETLPRDFVRNPRIHRSYEIRLRTSDQRQARRC